MGAERKRYLKKIGKKIIEEQSAKMKQIMLESNPANIKDPEWIKNSKQIYLNEKCFRNNRTEVYRGERIGVDILLIQVPIDISICYLPIPGYYLHCLMCGDLIPMNPEITLKCRCGSIFIEPTQKKILFNPSKIEVVKLKAKMVSNISLWKSFLDKIKGFLPTIQP